MVPFWVTDVHCKARVYQCAKKPLVFFFCDGGLCIRLGQLTCDSPYWPAFTGETKGVETVERGWREVGVGGRACLAWWQGLLPKMFCAFAHFTYVTGIHHSACKQSSEPGDLGQWSPPRCTRWYQGRGTPVDVSHFNRCTFMLAFTRNNIIGKGRLSLL